MTIIIESRKYNFYANNNEYWVTYADNEYIHYLTEEETKELLKLVFSTEINYSHNENGYEIYLDTRGNKRYFKDGKEDYGLFFLNNGESALLSLDKEKNDEKKDSTIKRIMVNIEFGLVTFLLSFSMTNMLRFAELKYRQPEVTQIPIERLEVKEATYLIDNSSDLSPEEKQYFKNIVFFVDVLKTAEPSRAEELRQRLTELGILNFTDDELNNPYYNNLAGYYDDIENNNKIHLRDYTYFDYAAAHEFVHLCQDPSCPIYIREACAEIMAHEYFGTYLNAYRSARDNITYLMEIIGPQPIMECNFKGDITSFRNTIGEYLSEEDTKALMDELYIPPKRADHKKIKSLLEKMADKKFENQDDAIDQKQQIELRSKYRSKNDGYYFNQSKSGYFINHYESSNTWISRTYYREEDKDIKRLEYNKVRVCENEELKAILENSEYDDCAIYVMDEKLTSAKRYPVREIKEMYPVNTYQYFVDYISNGNETRLEWVEVVEDPKEISAILDNPQDGKEYHVESDRGTFIIRKDKKNNNLIKTMNSLIIIPPLSDLFPEQTAPHQEFQSPDENATFIPFK
jgi:hypothetical protein